MKRPPKTITEPQKVDHRKNGDGIVGYGYVHTIAWVPDEPDGEVGCIAYYDRFENCIGHQRVQVIYECPVCNEHCKDKTSADIHCEKAIKQR